jgi:hypothetical protein
MLRFLSRIFVEWPQRWQIASSVHDGEDLYLGFGYFVEDTVITDDELAHQFRLDFRDHPSRARIPNEAAGGCPDLLVNTTSGGRILCPDVIADLSQVGDGAMGPDDSHKMLLAVTEPLLHHGFGFLLGMRAPLGNVPLAIEDESLQSEAAV